MSGENPYAPPLTTSAGVPDAPESFGWQLVGNRVWAEKFAQFTMVDPYSGESNDVMTMNRLTVRQRPVWLSLLSWACIGVMFLPLWPLPDSELTGIIAFGGFIGLIATLIAVMFFPLCGLKVFFTKGTLRTRTIQQWALSTCFLIAVLSGMTAGNSGLLSRFLSNWISSIAFGLWFLGLIWKNLIQRRLTCRRRKDGQFEIRGFHPKALAFLSQEKSAPRMHTSEAASV